MTPPAADAVDITFAPALPAPALAERLRAGEIHVWRAHREAAAGPDALLLLSAGERERAARLRIAAQRDNFIAAHHLLRRTLAGYLGRDGRRLEFETAPGGKPALRDGALQFNLSHCGGAALVVLAQSDAVGIDLENIDRRLDEALLAEACLHARECAAHARLCANQRRPTLLQWWTRKEALLKAQGCGLARDPRGVYVGWPVTPGATGQVFDANCCWTLCDLPLGAGWHGTVVVAGRPVAVCDYGPG